MVTAKSKTGDVTEKEFDLVMTASGQEHYPRYAFHYKKHTGSEKQTSSHKIPASLKQAI